MLYPKVMHEMRIILFYYVCTFILKMVIWFGGVVNVILLKLTIYKTPNSVLMAFEWPKALLYTIQLLVCVCEAPPK